MANAAVNGIRVEYETWGDPAAPAVLLIMGLGMQLTSWPDAFRDGLVAGGFRSSPSTTATRAVDADRRAPRPEPPLQIARRGCAPVHSPYKLDDMAADAVGLPDGSRSPPPTSSACRWAA
jgi:pimeloyl-ACP methyl ester carboxylesterase